MSLSNTHVSRSPMMSCYVYSQCVAPKDNKCKSYSCPIIIVYNCFHIRVPIVTNVTTSQGVRHIQPSTGDRTESCVPDVESSVLLRISSASCSQCHHYVISYPVVVSLLCHAAVVYRVSHVMHSFIAFIMPLVPSVLWP